MQEAIKDVMLGIMANGLTSLLSYIWSLSTKNEKSPKEIHNLLTKNATLSSILQKAAAEVARNTPSKEKLKEKIQLFLISPDADAIIRQLYSSHLILDDKGHYINAIRKEFYASLALYINTEAENAIADSLFDALLNGCELALKIAIDNGILSAHEAKSAARHNVIMDELNTIQKNLDYLTTKEKLNIVEINDFEKKYRKQIVLRHGHIIPPHFDSARKLPIDDIYVPPSFNKISKQPHIESKLLGLSEFMSVVHRSVILGNPGGGKSTLASKVCHDLAHQYKDRLLSKRLLTPILVVLRDYGAERRSKNCSILQFIEQTANSKYQIKPPDGAFEYLLLNGRVAVIFDGLDELLDTSYRQEITGDVEAFCNLFPSVLVIVTSREVGYEEAPLSESKFDIYRLAPFNDKQVEQYASLWFGTDRDLSSVQQSQKVKSFLRESGIVPDLRSNPLMLALMCNIYRGENYIPKNRPDVYEKCALMLFERWDKSRGIHVSLSIEAHIRTAMMYLAYWIYSTPALQGGTTESNLILKATEYLCPRRFEDRIDAEKAAREFIEFCRGRAWVFTDTGTTKDGERLYQFTHRTFLEYFTAAYLTRTHYTPSDLSGVLIPRISKREWDVVAQLAIQLQNKNIEGAGDAILNILLDLSRSNRNEDSLNALSFVAKCLEFMVPSPRTSREISLLCAEYLLSWGERSVVKKPTIDSLDDQIKANPESKKMEELLPSLLTASVENRDSIASSLEKELIERINKGSEKQAIVALELALHLSLALSLKRDANLYEELIKYWCDVETRIHEACKVKLIELSPVYIRACIDAIWRGDVSIGDFAKWHGSAALFQGVRFVLYTSVWTTSFAEVFLRSLTRLDDPKKVKKNVKTHYEDLERVGSTLLKIPPPWIIKKSRGGFPVVRHLLERSSDDKKKIGPLRMSSDALFGAVVIFAALLESEVENLTINFKNMKSKQHPLTQQCLNIFVARFEPMEMHLVDEEMNKVGFSFQQKELMSRWIRKDINFVANEYTQEEK